MKTKRLYLPMFVLGLVGISVGGVACSDGGTADPSGTGGAPVAGTGGTVGTGGQSATGGATSGGSSGTGGVPATGGTGGLGGSATGGTATGGAATGGSATGGTSTGGSATGGTSGAGAGGRGGMATGARGQVPAAGAAWRQAVAARAAAGRGGSATGGTAAGGTGGPGSGTCTASKSTGRTVSGTGPHQVVVETNSDNGIKCGTIYRPADLGGTEKYPIFVWGEGGCSQDGYRTRPPWREIASWGYFIVADGTPRQHERLRGRARWEGVPRLHHVGHRRERQVVQRVLPEPRDDEDRGGRILVRRIDVRECLGRSPLHRHRDHQQRADERESGSLQARSTRRSRS